MRFDYLLVGGGLQSSLIALALRHQQTDCTIAIVEREAVLGGNHTWCFHQTDVSAAALRWLSPLIVQRWPGYAVHFPRLDRQIDQPYLAITSTRLAQVVAEELQAFAGCQLFTGVQASGISARGVTLADGRTLEGRLVVDSRGPQLRSTAGSAGYQKFVGLEVELAQEAPFARPILMDARVSQEEGYHFIYVLPFGPRQLLVEDTYFTDSSHLAREAARQQVLDYLARQGLTVARVLREEEGVLPMPWGPLPAALAGGVLRGGYGGGWFHPGTGFSLPIAVRLAEAIAAVAPGAFLARLPALRQAQQRQARWARLLNWMLFQGIHPEERWHILQTFYRHPAPTIARFYALRLTAGDLARILAIRPPAGMAWAKVASWAWGSAAGREERER